MGVTDIVPYKESLATGVVFDLNESPKVNNTFVAGVDEEFICLNAVNTQVPAVNAILAILEILSVVVVGTVMAVPDIIPPTCVAVGSVIVPVWDVVIYLLEATVKPCDAVNIPEVVIGPFIVVAVNDVPTVIVAPDISDAPIIISPVV